MSFAKQHLLSVSVAACATLAVLSGHLIRQKVEHGSSPRIVLERSQNLLVSSTTPDEISALEFYSQMTGLLQDLYVDPIEDGAKLLAGGVRGMVGSLRDPKSFFLAEPQWRTFEAARMGDYEGVGADFIMDPSAPIEGDEGSRWAAMMPRLVVATVVPGGPADQAGLKAGDIIEEVNGHWVANGEIVGRFLAMLKQVRNGKGSQAELDKIREEYKNKSEKRTSPWRALETLSQGTSGDVKLVWTSGGKNQSGNLSRRASRVEPLVADGSSIKVRVQQGLADRLEKAIAGQSSVKLDLRNNAYCDAEAVPELLGVLAGSGTFGFLARERDSQRQPLKSDGNGKVAKLEVLVDASTHDSAQVLALALKKAGATLVDGGMKLNPVRVDRVTVESVGGYTLTRDRFEAEEGGR